MHEPSRALSARTADAGDIRRLLEGRSSDPFRTLGIQPVRVGGKPCFSIRCLLPGAESVEALVEPATQEHGGRERAVDLERTGDAGFFECLVPGEQAPRYRLRATLPGGASWEFEDPYRFEPVLGDLDLHLLAEGSHFRSYDKLGSHPITHQGVAGVVFAVWAPNADRVSVVGSFNAWDGRRHPMRSRGGSGIWELFIPGLAEGDLYKYEIRTAAGELRIKTDPYGNCFEMRPATSSVVCDLRRHQWSDADWLERRARADWLERPVSIYEVHLGSWMRVPDEGCRFLTYRELAPRLVEYARDMGFTHLELLPILEHPFDGSWGYQCTGYFGPTRRHGDPEDLMYFIDYCHRHDIGVILDWVPAHFPRDDFSLRLFDGTHLYEHADPRRGEHRDWGTLIFNYGRNEVRNFLLSSALFWLDRFHFDGLRVDAVASMLYLDYSKDEGDWLPNEHGGKENLPAIEFLKSLNVLAHEHHPGVLTIAEESTAWPSVSRPTYVGGLGFSMKWNMGWMNDTLAYFQKEAVHRKFHQQNLTFSLLYAFSENFILPLSHDEVVHGKRSLLDRMPGDAWQKFANLRLLFGFQFTHPGKKLLFMGCEFGAGKEWTSDESLDWDLLSVGWHRGVQTFVRDLNRLYRREPALHQLEFSWEGFQWIDFHNADESIVAFLRRGRGPGEELIVALNFTPVPRTGYRIGVPAGGAYVEVLNSDAPCYGGSGQGNLGRVDADPWPSHGRPWSLGLTLPPLGLVVLKRQA